MLVHGHAFRLLKRGFVGAIPDTASGSQKDDGIPAAPFIFLPLIPCHCLQHASADASRLIRYGLAILRHWRASISPILIPFVTRTPGCSIPRTIPSSRHILRRCLSLPPSVLFPPHRRSLAQGSMIPSAWARISRSDAYPPISPGTPVSGDSTLSRSPVQDRAPLQSQ